MKVNRRPVVTHSMRVAHCMIAMILSAVGTGFTADEDALRLERVASFVGDTGNVTALAVSADSQFIAVGSTDYLAPSQETHSVRLLDFATARELAFLGQHTAPIDAIAFSPDGSILATTGQDKTFTLWDVASRKLRFDYSAYGRGRGLAFTPDGQRVIVVGKVISVWNALSGRQEFTVDPEFPASCVAISPDGTRWATAERLSDDPVKYGIRLRDPTTGAIQATLNADDFELSSVSYSPDGQTLVAGSWNETVKVWSLETQELVTTLFPAIGSVFDVQFSPDGASLAIGNWSVPTRLYSTATWDELAQFPDGTGRCLRFSGDGQYLVATGSPKPSPNVAPLAEVSIWKLAQ